ncbi:MAG TPA: hypothetical protein H9735_02670 [Candidatus Anaerostipes excrementavium]|uniref:Uncharacterized protein n=1 Tax=Candidatus Anaerostipes excrementavium TaxID=2838463 RepID=A0A9D2B8J6_9FIRM|nr:hypothetical protein [uncultured Anaerostipes sp.]HIX67016.1 hypothetical protein [Candidatus Anaerostipes excrementavium]
MLIEICVEIIKIPLRGRKMSGGHLLCADRSGTKTHCGGVKNVAKATRRRRRIQQSRIPS